jgi:hypothetical protein
MIRRAFTIAAAVVLVAAPRAALACPVCFGQNDSPLAQGVNMGILAMLVIIGGVLAGFGAFIVRLALRARAFNEAAEAQTAATYSSNPQEGTAQC